MLDWLPEQWNTLDEKYSSTVLKLCCLETNVAIPSEYCMYITFSRIENLILLNAVGISKLQYIWLAVEIQRYKYNFKCIYNYFFSIFSSRAKQINLSEEKEI